LTPTTRRDFLRNATSAAAAAVFLPRFSVAEASDTRPDIRFPSGPRDRIAIASYPFRDFVAGKNDAGGKKMELKDFCGHVAEKFKINKIEPWSEHFRSLDASYLNQIRASASKAGGAIVNIAVDGRHSPYAENQKERDSFVAFTKQWIDAAATVGSPSIRKNMPQAKDSTPNVERAAETYRLVAEYAAQKSVVVNMENDNPLSEDPVFIAKIVGAVNSPWLRALPDFANTLTTGREEYAYRGLEQLFHLAYNICHVKDGEENDNHQRFNVDMAKTFEIMKNASFPGYCSMEFDRPGDPYKGTAELIETTLRYLA
jgi:hypothetical protein